jgi:hypothetical protein
VEELDRVVREIEALARRSKPLEGRKAGRRD